VLDPDHPSRERLSLDGGRQRAGLTQGAA